MISRMTRFWTIADRPTSLQIHAISNLLLEGGVVLLPTDTIYGLHALALDETAVAKVVEIKGRDDNKPFMPKGPTGVGVRTLVGVAEGLSKVESKI